MGRPLGTKGLINADKRRRLEETIGEVRRLKNEARAASSWSAVERFQKQERELFVELGVLNDAERGPTVLDPERALSEVILPALAHWPRPFLERLLKAVSFRLGVRLAVDVEADEPDSEAV